MPPNAPRHGHAERIGKYLGERLPLQFEIGARVTHRGGDTGMPEKLADGRELDAGLQQMNHRGVTQRMRMKAPSLRGRSIVREILSQEVPHPKSGQRSAVANAARRSR